MKHLEPLPKHLSKEIAAKQKSSPSSTMFKFLVASLLIILGLGGSLTAIFGPFSGDHVSQKEQADIAEKFKTEKFVRLEEVNSSAIADAIRSMKLDDQQQKLLQQRIIDPNTPQLTATDPSRVALAWIELWDFAAEDGDAVHLSSAGYEIDVPIAKTPIRLAIPVDGTSVVNISGLHDGGGGITLGVRSGQAPVMLPLIRKGQAVTIPLSL